MFILAIDLSFMKLLRYVLFPFVPLYYLITWLRNRLYDLGWKTSESYNIPVICVGNLSVGGTGKTPTVEYLVQLLKTDYKVAILSRGYKRNTKGFVMADENASASSIGDEPFQYYRKFKDVTIAVDANRRNGIAKLIAEVKPDVIILDDAFQHRKVKAKLNVLLTAYDNLYCNDMVLPTGNLREPKSGAKRAHLIMVTKCPDAISEKEKNQIIKQLRPLEGQEVFFSSIAYSDVVFGVSKTKDIEELKKTPFTLVTGIANPKPLLRYLKNLGLQFDHLQFKDHHEFSDSDIKNLKSKSMIVTTEKDYVRLVGNFEDDSKLYYLPIQFKVDRAKQFEDQIKSFL
ncbi:tetraacyldisaccharide 4'-kinase [Psychroserpens sp. XS_ASV72]|uniref:tetraacyldisaccharide 4'-kinase n=1 Tax=Psychroserpens sp. XS_ASV72 TaxID=3241293 RepID=UPI003518EDC5